MTTERSGMSLESVVSFLLGESELDGVWFGEKHERRRGSFWWRDILRVAYADHLSRDAVVSDESWRPVVSKVLTALDIATGDTDPNIDPDMTDDEVRDEYPEIWAMQKLSLLLANQPESLASLKVAVPDGYVLSPITPTAEMEDAAFDTFEIDDAKTQGFNSGTDARNAIYKAMIEASQKAMLASQDEVK